MTHQHIDARSAVPRWGLGRGGAGLACRADRDDNRVIPAGQREAAA
jgi:hypothetical protein